MLSLGGKKPLFFYYIPAFYLHILCRHNSKKQCLKYSEEEFDLYQAAIEQTLKPR